MKTFIKTIMLMVPTCIILGYLLAQAIIVSGFNLDIKVACSYNKPVVHVEYIEERKEIMDF